MENLYQIDLFGGNEAESGHSTSSELNSALILTPEQSDHPSEKISILDVDGNVVQVGNFGEKLFSADLIEEMLAEADAVIEGITKFSQEFQAFMSQTPLDSRVACYLQPHIVSQEAAILDYSTMCWNALMHRTGLIGLLPIEESNEWKKNLEEKNVPVFNREFVYDFLNTLSLNASLYFAKSVDDCFRRLSKTHITNHPTGFRGKLIFNTGDSQFKEAFSRLRLCVEMILNPVGGIRDAASMARRVLSLPFFLRYGNQAEGVLDGGAIRFKMYKSGTVHVWVHDDVAMALNRALALLYPSAISDVNLRRSAKKCSYSQTKEVTLHQVNVTRSVSEELMRLSVLEIKERKRDIQLALKHISAMGYTHYVRVTNPEALPVLTYLGGYVLHKITNDDAVNVFFMYDPSDALTYIAEYRSIPDFKTYQYYPTPPSLATELVAWANICAGDKVLEPSAGQGGILGCIKDGNVTAIEISPLHCRILRAKGFHAVEGDFLKKADEYRHSFDVVVMNPPFSENQWKHHLNAALSCVIKGGCVVAIVPASFRPSDIKMPVSDILMSKDGKEMLFHDAFENTGVSVRMIKIIL